MDLKRYEYKEGKADAYNFSGSVEDPKIEKLSAPVASLVDHKIQAKIVWQIEKDQDSASVIVAKRLKLRQGNTFALLPMFREAFRIMFDVQGYKWCYSRAEVPRNDNGVRTGEDWRRKQVIWRMRHDSMRPIMMSRLNKLWLSLVPNSVPAQYVSDEYPKEGIIIFSPQLIRELGRETAQQLEEDIGETGRRWDFFQNFDV